MRVLGRTTARCVLVDGGMEPCGDNSAYAPYISSLMISIWWSAVCFSSISMPSLNISVGKYQLLLLRCVSLKGRTIEVSCTLWISDHLPMGRRMLTALTCQFNYYLGNWEYQITGATKKTWSFWVSYIEPQMGRCTSDRCIILKLSNLISLDPLNH